MFSIIWHLYFDQQMGALQAIHWSKSYFPYFNIFCPHKQSTHLLIEKHICIPDHLKSGQVKGQTYFFPVFRTPLYLLYQPDPGSSEIPAFKNCRVDLNNKIPRVCYSYVFTIRSTQLLSTINKKTIFFLL